MLNILIHFLEFNPPMMLDFFYVIKYNRKECKFNFVKDWLSLLNMGKKLNKRRKDKIICTV